MTYRQPKCQASSAWHCSKPKRPALLAASHGRLRAEVEFSSAAMERVTPGRHFGSGWGS